MGCVQMMELRRFVPRPVKRIARAAIRLSHGGIDVAQLALVKRDFRRRYGPRFVAAIHPRDEMFLHHRPEHRTHAEAAVAYFQKGEVILRDLETVLENIGVRWNSVESFLDFACGHGRVTRLAACRLPPQRVVASDINREAVDFVRQRFGVRGFYSTYFFRDLPTTELYDLIFVVSLFSHLAESYWEAWFARLSRMLTPRGVLVFTTLGPTLLHGRTEARPVSDGFHFELWNETHGRLAREYYGLAFVTEHYVRRIAESNGVGRIVGYYRDHLGAFQDVYALAKSG